MTSGVHGNLVTETPDEHMKYWCFCHKHSV